MSTYEFWNEIDKIFDAVLAYQEKNIEFNKRFINPWISLGNVFDKQDKSDLLTAHKNAIEIDPHNARNWCELGNTYTRAGNFDESIQAYQKALELGLKSGELYKNMALAYAMSGKYQESLPFFKQGLEMLEKDEEKAAVWNHIGNVYRKLNNYEMAFQAFQNADQLENKTGTTPVDQSDFSVTDQVPEGHVEETVVPLEDVNVSQPTEEAAIVMVSNAAPQATDDLTEECSEDEIETVVAEPGVEEHQAEEAIEDDEELSVIFDLDFSKEAPAETKQSVVQNVVNDENPEQEMPVSEFVAALEKESELDAGLAQTAQEEAEAGVEEILENTFEDPVESVDEPEQPEPVALTAVEGVLPVPTETITPVVNFAERKQEVKETNTLEPSSEDDVMPVFSAYEVYLKNNISPIGVNIATSVMEDFQPVSKDPGVAEDAKLEVSFDESTYLEEEVDTKNAQVWNELGNVYFNAGAYADAIAAYTKAIELDKNFAWPYSNLALSYVQKGRYHEAIFLYQRGIELFSNDTDKALTWNRLGNLYRRLNDYENAIISYQHADVLDPSKAAITRQSQFSLLGSEKVNLEVGYSL